MHLIVCIFEPGVMVADYCGQCSCYTCSMHSSVSSRLKFIQGGMNIINKIILV